MHTKTQQLQIRVSAAQKAALKRRAHAAGLGMSAYAPRTALSGATSFPTLRHMTQLRMTFRFALTALCVAAACASQNRLVTTTSGLGYRVRVEGSGPAAASGDTVSIHEITTLPSGVVIFSSRDKKTPVTFLLGGNQVISGVDEGVRGMRWASADC